MKLIIVLECVKLYEMEYDRTGGKGIEVGINRLLLIMSVKETAA